MAVIPRYISDSPATPAINTVKMDPSVAAAPHRAEEQAAANLTNIFQHEMGAWGNLLAQKQKEEAAVQAKDLKIQEDLFHAQSLGTLKMSSSALYNEARNKSDGTSNFAGVIDGQYQKMVDGLLSQAPTERAKINLLKSSIGLRASLYDRASNESFKMNNQANMDKIEKILSTAEGLVASNPMDIEAVKKGPEIQAAMSALSTLGVPQHVKQKIQDKFNTRMDYQAVKGLADKDPLLAKQVLESGNVAHLGEGNVTSLKNYVKSSVGAFTSQAKQAMEDVTSRLMQGQPLPQDIKDRMALANKYGLTEEVNTANQLMQANKLVTNAGLVDLQNLRTEFERQMRSNTDIKKKANFEKVSTYIDARLKAMKEDPLSYAENTGAFTPFNPITDFTKLSPQEIEQRKFRALQIQQHYGIAAPALKNSELDALAGQIDKMLPEQQGALIGALHSLGADTVSAVEKRLRKDGTGLAQAARIHDVAPDVANRIIQGQKALTNGMAVKANKEDSIDATKQALGELFAGNSTLQAQYLAAGKALQAEAQLNGREDASDLKQAIRKAGNIIEVGNSAWNVFASGPAKYTTVAPAPNMTEEDFQSFVDKNLKDVKTWQQFANGRPTSAGSGTPLNFNRMDPSDLSYRYEEKGKYQVLYQGRPVLTEQQMPLLIDLKGLYKARSK